MTRASFDSTKTHLHQLLKDAHDGRLQLPDFQRGWVWDDYGIRSLLASISQSFPCGAIMTLQNGGDVRFKPRGIEGRVTALKEVAPDVLLLDGQQRITSLYQACMQREVVKTLNAQRRRIERWYYIDMASALDPTTDREEAIVGLPVEKCTTRDFGREVVLDLSTVENEYQNLHFPVNRIFDADDWMMGFMQHWGHDAEKNEFWFKFKKEIIGIFEQYQMPVISLSKDTPREAVCLVFEKVNSGGKKLDAFELLTATYAADEFMLRDDWYGVPDNLKEHPGRSRILARQEVLKDLAPTDFLQAITLLHTLEQRERDIAEGKDGKQLTQVSCTRNAILNLPLDAYIKWADDVMEGFERAAKFLTRQKIFWRKDIPYRTQLVPLAAIHVRLKQAGKADVESVFQKISQWFWCGVFGELYGSAVETRFGLDIQQVPAWIDGGPTPKTINDANFVPGRLESLTTRLSAAYKGVHALLMRSGAEDLKSGQAFVYTSFWDERVDIHHIFPRVWCDKIGGIKAQRRDCIINKTPLASATNRIIGGDAPSRYLRKLRKTYDLGDDRLNSMLQSHLIDPDSLSRDDFEAFFSNRKERLLLEIEKATGKPIPRDAIEDEPGEIVETPDEPEEEDAPAVEAPEDDRPSEAAQ